jgi:hypothetical protein
MSSNVHTALSRNDWHLDLVTICHPNLYRAIQASTTPVNDTGLGPQCGDLQVSREFAC